MQNLLLAIDPGIEMGVARFVGGRLIATQTLTGKGGSWDIRADDVMYAFEEMIEELPHVPVKVACEWPAYMPGAGQVSAESGSLIKLAELVGRIHQAVKSSGGTFIPVTVVSWKGQLNKKECQRRIAKRLSKYESEVIDREASSHIWDAVGIGLHQLGRGM